MDRVTSEMFVVMRSSQAHSIHSTDRILLIFWPIFSKCQSNEKRNFFARHSHIHSANRVGGTKNDILLLI